MIMQHQYSRSVICIKDLVRFFGCSYSAASKKSKKIKEDLNLNAHAVLTIYHLAKYSCLTIEEIRNALFNEPL